MATKLTDLAKKSGLEVAALKEKMKELGFEVALRARTVEDDIAELILAELTKKEEPAEKKPEDVAEIYDELIAQEREREIVKSQRKKMAGKDAKKEAAKKEAEAAAAVVIDTSKPIEISDMISVKEFSEKTGIKAAKIIGELMKNGILANINQQIDFETAQVIADDLNVKIKRIRSIGSTEEFISGDISNLIKEDDPAMLKTRPPVVCVMGHVDHGKTTLLDAIRDTHVVEGESGGITQHIGAYQVTKNGRVITFLDTPGHEAFTSMRARGAKVTDVAILVVAAEEGCKPQTIEAINHAQEAGVPIIVAVNKIDKPGANPDKVKAELAEHGLTPEEWGGKTVMVPVSALKKQGIDELLDIVLLTADMEDLKANPDREAIGTVIEAHLNPSLGPVATILINTGTLKLMDNVIVGAVSGRIKLMRDYSGKALKTAGPSTPVFIAGLSATPKNGDILQVVKNESLARSKASELALIAKVEHQEKMSSMNQLISNVKSDKVLKIVLKADAKGSIEAIKQSLAKIKHDEVAIKIIHSGVGDITESDVMMAAASKGVIYAFHSNYNAPYVKRTAERENVEVKLYTVIYNLIEDTQKILSGMLEAEILDTVIGRAQIKQIFFAKKNQWIVGCRVLSGKMVVKSKVRILRGQDEEGNDKIIGNGILDSLKKAEEVVHEIKEGNECGIKFVGDVELQEGDTLEAHKEEKKVRTI